MTTMSANFFYNILCLPRNVLDRNLKYRSVFSQAWNKSGLLECLENLYPFYFISYIPLQIKFKLCTTINCCSFTVLTVLGFGANCVTLILILVLGISRRNGRRIWRVCFTINLEISLLVLCGIIILCIVIAQVSRSRKFFLFFIPAIGATLTFVDIIFLLKKALQGEFLPYYKWLFKGSQFAVWVSFLKPFLLAYFQIVLNSKW